MANTFGPRSVAKWRSRGYFVDTVEQFIRLPGGRSFRKDLFGFADLVAVPLDQDQDGRLLFIQVTSWTNVASRVKKIREEDTGRGQHTRRIRDIAHSLLRGGNTILVEGWKKNTQSGQWECRTEIITEGDLT